jgi:hypothetical protein
MRTRRTRRKRRTERRTKRKRRRNGIYRLHYTTIQHLARKLGRL